MPLFLFGMFGAMMLGAYDCYRELQKNRLSSAVYILSVAFTSYCIAGGLVVIFGHGSANLLEIASSSFIFWFVSLMSGVFTVCLNQYLDHGKWPWSLLKG